MPNINVISLHGLQSHPDILGNALHKIETTCVDKLVSSCVDSSSMMNTISFSYPCAPVAVERTFTMKGEAVPIEVNNNNNNNNNTIQSGQQTQDGDNNNFEKIQLYGWMPQDCVCCQSESVVAEKNKKSSSSSSPCFSSFDSKNHYKAAFEIVLGEIEKSCCSSSDENYFVLLAFSQGGLVVQTLITALFADASSSSPLIKNLSSNPAFLGGDQSAKDKYRALFSKYCVGLVFAGSPCSIVSTNATSNNNSFFPSVPSLHIIGENDKLVNKSESSQLLKLFESPSGSSDNEAQQCSYQPSLYLHDGGHPIPTNPKAVKTFFTFFQKRCLVLAHQKRWFIKDAQVNNNNNTEESMTSTFTNSISATMQKKQAAALSELKDTLTEELEVVTCALPEGSNVSCVINSSIVQRSFTTFDDNNNNNTVSSPLSPATSLKKATSSIIDPSVCVDVLVEMMLPGLEENAEIREAFFATLTKKSLRIRKWDTKNNNEDDDDDDEYDNQQSPVETAASNAIQKQGMVRLTIKVPLGYPLFGEDPIMPRCVLSSLPPLLAIQSHRNAQLLSAVYDACRDLAGSPLVMNICLCVLSELEAWVSAAASQILDGGLSRADSTEEDFLEKAAVMNDPWLVEMDYDEREKLVSQIHAEVDQELAVLDKASNSKGKKAGAQNVIAQNPGQWCFTVIMLGKPSSGKSSTFNCISDPESESAAAKVGSFPFTTIEPNISRAWCGIPCLCRLIYGRQEEDTYCGACYGHLPDIEKNSDDKSNNKSTLRFRRHPIEVKDVAGLVKGAYQGKGKGNRFLNDLCDADVLIHVVDGGGRSTAEGVELDDNNNKDGVEGASAAEDDVEWIRNEIHNWMFDNVASKWDAIRRKPQKLLQMFTGYHANLRLTEAALERSGVKLNEVDVRIPAWAPRDLHRLIAHFIRLRFPILIAVNKVDVPGCQARAAKISQRFPGHVVKTMSARVECELLRLRREGKIKYASGSSDFEINTVSSLSDKEKNVQIPALKKFLAKYKSTGIQEVLAAAISLRPPLLCFPLDTNPEKVIQSYQHHQEQLKQSGGQPIDQRIQAQTTFKDCLTLRQGTTAEHAFKTAGRLGLLDGSSGTSSSSSAPSVSSNRYHEYSLVRCDVVELPMEIVWNGQQQQQQSQTEPNRGENDDDDHQISFRKTVCRKEEVLSPVCVVKMVGKKG